MRNPECYSVKPSRSTGCLERRVWKLSLTQHHMLPMPSHPIPPLLPAVSTTLRSSATRSQFPCIAGLITCWVPWQCDASLPALCVGLQCWEQGQLQGCSQKQKCPGCTEPAGCAAWAHPGALCVSGKPSPHWQLPLGRGAWDSSLAIHLCQNLYE